MQVTCPTGREGLPRGTPPAPPRRSPAAPRQHPGQNRPGSGRGGAEPSDPHARTRGGARGEGRRAVGPIGRDERNQAASALASSLNAAELLPYKTGKRTRREAEGATAVPA